MPIRFAPLLCVVSPEVLSQRVVSHVIRLSPLLRRWLQARTATALPVDNSDEKINHSYCSYVVDRKTQGCLLRVS